LLESVGKVNDFALTKATYGKKLTVLVLA